MDLGINFKQLQELFDPKDEESSDDDQPVKSSNCKLGPGDLGPKKKSKPPGENQKKSAYEKKVTKDIWNEEDVDEGAEFDTSDDPRMQPEYEIVYKQKVTSEDIFLQMGSKNPSTTNCEDMIVKIKLPGVNNITEIDVNVFEKFLDCRTNIYRLGLHLPHPVDDKSANAKWDPKESTLLVTMTMKREFDFVNF